MLESSLSKLKPSGVWQWQIESILCRTDKLELLSDVEFECANPNKSEHTDDCGIDCQCETSEWVRIRCCTLFLALQSEVFEAMFFRESGLTMRGHRAVDTDSDAKEECLPLDCRQCIRIEDCSADAISVMCDFAMGRFNLARFSRENIAGVLQVAHKYQMAVLCRLCEQFILTEIVDKNLYSDLAFVFSQLQSHALCELLLASPLIGSRLTAMLAPMFSSDACVKLPFALLRSILASDLLHCSEESVWNQCVKWAQHNCGQPVDSGTVIVGSQLQKEELLQNEDECIFVSTDVEPVSVPGSGHHCEMLMFDDEKPDSLSLFDDGSANDSNGVEDENELDSRVLKIDELELDAKSEGKEEEEEKDLEDVRQPEVVAKIERCEAKCALLQMCAPFIRFPQMGALFFSENVCRCEHVLSATEQLLILRFIIGDTSVEVPYRCDPRGGKPPLTSLTFDLDAVFGVDTDKHVKAEERTDVDAFDINPFDFFDDISVRAPQTPTAAAQDEVPLRGSFFRL